MELDVDNKKGTAALQETNIPLCFIEQMLDHV